MDAMFVTILSLVVRSKKRKIPFFRIIKRRMIIFVDLYSCKLKFKLKLKANYCGGTMNFDNDLTL